MRHQISFEVAGVCNSSGTPYRWHAAEPVAVADFDRLRAVVSVGAFEAAVAEGESIAQSSVTDFVLVADDGSQLGQRPIDIFSRVGAQNLSASQVWQTLQLAAGDTVLQIASGGTIPTPAAIPTGTALHIGNEMIVTQADYSPGDAGVAVGRGAGGTIAQPHRAAGAGYLARTIPVTLQPTEWIGRQVTVYVDGAVWRIGFLIDNPTITTSQIVLSYVSNENLLSVERSGEYTPQFGTTLAPNTVGKTQGWAPWVVMPSKNWAVPASARQLVTQDAVATDTTVYQLSGAPAKNGYLALWDHWQSGQMGYAQKPHAFVTFGRTDFLDGVGPASIEFEWAIDQYLTTGSTTVDFQIPKIKNDAYQALLSCVSSGAVWYLQQIRRESFVAPDSAVAAPYDGQSVNYTQSGFYGSTDITNAPFGWSLTNASIDLKSYVSPQVGCPIANSQYWIGVISRRNARPEEVDAPDSVGNIFNGLAYCPPWGGQYSATGQPCYPDNRCPHQGFYPVRPKQDGDFHATAKRRGCVLSADFWRISADQNRASIPADVAIASWEIGQNQIWLLATIPGIADDGQTGSVSIAWEEPDGEKLTALARVSRNESGDDGGYYCYDIESVWTADGSVCAGFGSWPQCTPCTITRPVGTGGDIGSIVSQIIASGDGTSGRTADNLGDGLGCPITQDGFLSFAELSSGLIPNGSWIFQPEKTSYTDFLRLVCSVCGVLFVGRYAQHGGDLWAYGPQAVPAGRAIPSEIVAEWSDADFIGIPTNSGDNGLVYTSYKISTAGREYNAPDWLAADLFGQGEEFELDLTDVYRQPLLITDDSIQSIVDSLRNRYGVARRRWSVRVPVDIGLQRCVGDVVSVTSDYLISADGQIGVAAQMARIMSIKHDLVGGVCDVDLISYATYSAGYSQSWDVTISAVSGTTYTLDFLTSVDPITAMRQRWDRLYSAPQTLDSSTVFLVCAISGAGSGGYMYGYFTAWAPATSGGSCTFVRQGGAAPSTPPVGSRCLVFKGYNSSIPANMVNAFRNGTSKLL